MATSEKGGMITGAELVVGDMQKSPAPEPAAQNSLLTYTAEGAAAYKPVSGSSLPHQPAGVTAGGGPDIYSSPLNSGNSLKRRRGRPRKYGPDGTMAMTLVHAAAMPQPSIKASPPNRTFSPPAPPPSAAPNPNPRPRPPPSAATAICPPPSAALLTHPATPSSPPSSAEKGRARPPSRKQQDTEALEWSAGVPMMGHSILFKEGEDLSAKILSFSQTAPGAVFVVTANGSISNVTLRQPSMSGGMATYEGRFDILSLSGSFLPSEVGGQRSMTGGLNAVLMGTDGRLLGGCVAGLLIAASPVQVMLSSCVPEGHNESKSENHTEQALIVNPVVAAGASSPPSRGALNESSGGPGSSLDHSSGACNNVNLGILQMPWK